MMLHKHRDVSRIVLAGALLGLAGCGSGSRTINAGNFSGTKGFATPSGRAAPARLPAAVSE